MNAILRCITEKNLSEIGFESIEPYVNQLWVIETEQNEIDSNSLNIWIRETVDKLYKIIKKEKLEVSLFINSGEMEKPLVIEVKSLSSLLRINATVEFFSN